MRFHFSRIFLIILISWSSVKDVVASQISCEKVAQPGGDNKSCKIEDSTVIESAQVSISSQRDETVTSIELNGNKNIQFLPSRVDTNFPNLEFYIANDCSISTISKDNFQNLSQLKVLFLQQNQIEEIPLNAFDDLGNLVGLNLGMTILMYDLSLKISCRRQLHQFYFERGF